MTVPGNENRRPSLRLRSRPAILKCLALLAISFGASTAFAWLRVTIQKRRASPQHPIAAARAERFFRLAFRLRSSQIRSNLPSREKPLLLGAGDLLELSRLGHRPSCRASSASTILVKSPCPLHWLTFTVLGLTAEQVQVAIEDRFRERDILHHPHVEVFVLEYATQGVTVMGEVKLPGISLPLWASTRSSTLCSFAPEASRRLLPRPLS